MTGIYMTYSFASLYEAEWRKCVGVDKRNISMTQKCMIYVISVVAREGGAAHVHRARERAIRNVKSVSSKGHSI